MAGGCGNEHTQRANVTAFEKWGIVPRMFNGSYERDLSIELFGMRLPTPLFTVPIGIIGICSQDFHGDLHVARAAARTGVPVMQSTLSMDPMEDLAPAMGDTPGFFQLYTPEGPRPRREPHPARRGRRLQGDRRHPRHMGDRLAPPGPQRRELPAAARLLPGQLLHRRALPQAAREEAR